MAKRYTFFQIILPIALFVIPSLLWANGEPKGNPLNGNPTTPDSVAAVLGHCNPITKAVVNCTTHTIELSAYVQYTFTGVLDPIVATWSDGQIAHKITVVPPGMWDWDASGTGCEQNHWDNVYNQPGTFFEGTLDILGDPLCQNGSIDLTVVTTNPDDYEFPNYAWNPPSQGSGLSPYEVTQPGLYSLTVTDDLGCTFTDQFNVPNSPPVNPILTGPAVMCPEGDTSTVQVTQTWVSYLWSNGETTNPTTVTEPGIYDVTVTNQYGCTGVGFFGVQSGEVGDFPISITAQKICIGDPDTLRVVGGYSQYHWSNNVNTLTNIVTTPGTYTVTVTNQYGCTGVDSVTVGLKPTPTITASHTPLCPGGTSTLTATGGQPSYTWSSGQTTNPVTINAAGTYTVTVSGTSICPATASVVVPQLPPPTNLISPPALLTCTSPQVTLNASLSSSGPDFPFTWTTVGGHFFSGQNTLTPVVDAAGTYTLLITNALTGCTSTSSVTVTANQQAPPSPTGPGGTLTCVLTSLTLGPGAPPAPATLVPMWSTGFGGNIVSGGDTWNPLVDLPGTYTLLVTDPSNGCTSTSSVAVGQNTALPNAQAAPPALLTCTMNTSVLDGSGSSSGPNFTYLWTTANGTISGSTTTAVTSAASVGTYVLLVTNTLNGCTSTASVTVSADLNIPVVGAQPPALLTCAITNVTIDATASSSGPSFQYTWTGPTPGSVVSGQGTLTPTVNAPGTYVMNLLNTSNNCFATLSVVVPQDITPPVADAGQSATLNCVVPSLNLDGSGSSSGAGFTYQWSTLDGTIVSGANGLTPNVSKAGTYTLVVTNQSNGCTSSSTVQVLNDASAPVAVIAPPVQLTCATLQALVDGQASSQGGTYQLTWSGPGIVGGQNTPQITVDLPGTYTLDIVNTANGCTDTESVTVTQDIAAPGALAGPDGLINCTAPQETVGSASNPSGPGITYQWTTLGGNLLPPTNGPTASVDAAGTYTLLVTNTLNGCTSTDVVSVAADFAAPLADAGNTFELNCVQTSYVLQGTGSTGPSFSYVWTSSPGGNIVSGQNTLTPTVNKAGTYTLLVTNNANGCTSTDLVNVTVSADVPVPVIAQPGTLTCAVQSLNLNANGSTGGPTVTYSWTTSGSGNISGGGSTLTPTVTTPGVYMLSITDNSNSCTATASVTVPQNIQDPVVDAGAPATLTCAVTALPLSATMVSSSSPNISYAWSTIDGTIQGGANTASPNVTAAGTYVVVVTDAINSCTGTDQVVIASNTVPPVAAIAPPATLTCTLQSTPIDATASSMGANFEYLWATGNGQIVSGGTTLTPIVGDPGLYNLLITNTQNGCTQTASVTVPENVLHPAASAGPTVGLDCDTQSNTLDGSASSQGPNFAYLWSTGNGQILGGGTTLSPQIGDPGLYSLTVTDLQNGCTTSSSVTVTEDVAPPVFAIAPPPQLTCVTLSALLSSSGSGLGSAPSYAWATSNGHIVNGGTGSAATVDKPGTYTLTVTNTQNGCTDVEQITVDQNITPPPLSAQPVGPLTCSVLQRTLQANAPAQALLQWTTLDGHIVSGANGPNPVVDEAGLYTVTATLPLNGCTAVTTTQLLQELNVPTGLQFALDPPLCNGTLGLLMVSQIAGGVGPFQYSIDGGDTFFPAQDIDGLEPGEYDLVIRDANGCVIMQHVPVPAPPTPAVALPPSFSIVLGDHQDLLAAVPPAYPLQLIDQVQWEPLTGLSFAGSTVQEMLNPIATPFVTTEYKVTIVTKEGCKAESRTIIRVDRDIDIYAPNVIWPEDPDGQNGAFTLFTRQGSVNRILSLQVYDRWGEQLFVNKDFKPDDPSLGWPGDFKGELVMPGVFVWWAEVELIDGQKILMKGDVTVVR